jgi:hypothetical protein
MAWLWIRIEESINLPPHAAINAATKQVGRSSTYFIASQEAVHLFHRCRDCDWEQGAAALIEAVTNDMWC